MGTLFLLVFFTAGCSEVVISTGPEKDTLNFNSADESFVEPQDKIPQGVEKAKSEIIYFGDYECEGCRSFYEEKYPVLKEKLINDEKAKFYHYDVATVNEVSFVKAMMGVYIEEQFPDIFHSYIDEMQRLSSEENETILEKEGLITKMEELFPNQEWREAGEKVFSKSDEIESVLNANREFLEENRITELPVVFVDGVRVQDVYSVTEIMLRALEQQQ